MNYKIILIGIVLISTSCSLINHKSDFSSKKNEKMKKFDKRKFRDLRKEGKNSFFLKDSTKVKFNESEDYYSETRIEHKSQYCSVNRFYKSNESVKYSGQFFQKFPIGIHREYDEKGNLIKETNYDSDFLYSIDSLSVKLKGEYGIDINDPNLPVTIGRENHIFPQYKIFVNLKDDLYSGYRVLVFDGHTGELIDDRVHESKGCKN